MRRLSLIIALFGVFALLTLGIGGAWASSPASMSCHEASATHEGMMAPAHAPAKAVMVMGCCVACVSPSVPPAPVPVTSSHPRPAQPARVELPSGQSPSPEPAPPKRRP